MNSDLPVSNKSVPIQVPILGGAVYHIAFNNTSARTALGSGNILHSIYNDQDCYVLTGGSDVEVNSTTGVFLPAGRNGNYGRLMNHTHIAVIRASANGTLHFGEGAKSV